MKFEPKKGRLTTWKDDRGFGFIKPENGGKEVFLHISALKKNSRRPKIGDLILYQQVVESDSKIRAVKASIQDTIVQSSTTKRKKKKRSLLEVVVGVITLATIGLFITQFDRSRSTSPITSITTPPPITSIPKSGCVIKGNISIATGKKLYHLPGMEDYESTIIDLEKGEMWFCSESEAIESGWSKAPR